MLDLWPSFVNFFINKVKKERNENCFKINMQLILNVEN
jgi:hypothetical protein